VSGDFNGDGKLDLVVGYGTGSLGLMLGDGAGGFKPRIELTNFGVSIGKLLTSDVNRDGKLDLLVGTSAYSGDPRQTYVLLGRGDGTFQPGPQQVVSGYPLFVADLNGDRIPDLAAWRGSSCGGGFQIQLGNGDGTFQKPLPCIGSPDGSGSANAAVGDFNGDGKLDFVWGSGRSNGSFALFLGNGDGTFQLGSLMGPDNGEHTATISFAVGDLNHDGRLDLVIAGSRSVSVRFGNGDGSLQAPFVISPVLFSFTRGFGGASGIFVADFDGDGNLDLAMDNVVISGNGDGTFQAPKSFAAGSDGAYSVVCGDLNGDGLPDLVFRYNLSVGPNSTSLSVLLNNTPGLPNLVLGHSAASGADVLAPSSISSVYGKNLARVTASADGLTLPTQLGGISLRIRDVTDAVRRAPLFYVSPSQINFLLPEETAIGPVILTIDDGSTPLVESANATVVGDIAPGLFTADGQGQSEGVAAATAVRILADGSQQPVTVFKCASPGQCSTVPIDLASGQPIYLSLYGTGFHHLAGVTCQAGGKTAIVQYAGPQAALPGIDQINILLPKFLPPGPAAVQCQFNGFFGSTTNAVRIAIK